MIQLGEKFFPFDEYINSIVPIYEIKLNDNMTIDRLSEEINCPICKERLRDPYYCTICKCLM